MSKPYVPKYTSISLVVCIMLLSCGGRDNPQENRYAPSIPGKEAITDVNRYLSEKDKAIIEGYGRRNKLELTLSESGFYYHIFAEGNRKSITKNSTVSIIGTLCLIDGTLCYTYTPEHPKVIAIAKSPEITGLHIGLPMLKENGRAIFVFPANLAFGLLGDGDMVPPRTTIVMNISVIAVNE